MQRSRQRLEGRPFAQARGPVLSTEAKYWKLYKNPVLVQEYAPITSIDFCATAPHYFAITSSTRVQRFLAGTQFQIFDPRTNTVSRTFSRFHDVAYGARFRHDGKLLGAGGEEGVLRLFDMGTKKLLRTLEGHKGAVHLLRFANGRSHLLSAGDDASVREWDVPTGTQVRTVSEHTDRIRSMSLNPSDNNVYATGGYDHFIKLWDSRTPQAIQTFDHGFPVEDLLVYPEGTALASAGSNQIKVWDMFTGKSLHTLENHQKTITGLALDTSRGRLLSCSLDHHLKVYSTDTYAVVHTMKYPAPLLCLALSPDKKHIVAGMADGLLSIRFQSAIPAAAQDKPVVGSWEAMDLEPEAKRQLPVNSWRFWQRGTNAGPDTDSVTIVHTPQGRLLAYDKYLNKFQYRRALDATLESGDPRVVGSMLEELRDRNSLALALSGRTASSLLPLLDFLTKYLTSPAYTKVLIPVAELVIGQVSSIDAAFKKLLKVLTAELDTQRTLLQMLGALQVVGGLHTETIS